MLRRHYEDKTKTSISKTKDLIDLSQLSLITCGTKRQMYLKPNRTTESRQKET